MILVIVGHEDVRHSPRGARDLLQMFIDLGPGIDHDRRFLAHDPRVRAVKRGDARVRGEHADHRKRHDSCSITWRGMLHSSSVLGSRVSKRSASTSSREAHAASSLTVNQVGQ